MRQGQQHNKNRSRGRGGGGNRGGSGGGGGRQSNPLNRVFESNGPDVKVRGNAQTIADKYLQLARDAVSSGENVNAENYFQHAEHYLRIVTAAQAFNQQNQQAQQAQQNQQRREDGNSEGSAASGNTKEGESENKEAASEEDGVGDNNRQNNRRGNRGQRGNGRQRPTTADGDETVTRTEEAQPAAPSEGDENWQSQAPDFLRREAGERDGNASGNGDDAPVEDKPKRQPRARKAKPVKVADKSDDEKSPDKDASAASPEATDSDDASEDVSAA